MVNEELKGNWRDIFKVVKFSFDPKKIFIQMLGLLIAVCLLLVFIQMGSLISGLKCGVLPNFIFEAFRDIGSCAHKSACLHTLELNLAGKIFIAIGFTLFFMVFLATNGIVSRIAVQSFLKDEIMEMNEAVKYGIKNFKALIFSPVVLVIIIALTFIGLFICGLVGKIPYLGEIVISFSIIPIFLGGLLILFLLLVLSFGLFLLPSIIAVEDDDTFGAVVDLFFVIITNFWKLIGYRIIFKLVFFILATAVIGISVFALYLGGAVVVVGLGEAKFFALINAFAMPSTIFLKITNIITWVFIAFLSLYVICIPMVYSNLANTIIYCNLEEKLKLAREEETEEEKEESKEEETTLEKDVPPEESKESFSQNSSAD